MGKRGVVMSKMRVLHYVNQYFAGIGGEEKADVPAGMLEGPVGPGKRLQGLLGDLAQIVATAYCGDNYFNDHPKESLASILQMAREQDVKMLVAGPAFASGRYGFACAEVCHTISTSLDLYAVTGMHPENPGVERYRQYKERKVFLFPTTEVVSGMEKALSSMAQFLSKRIRGEPVQPPHEEGYIPRNFRIDEFKNQTSAVRAVNMLLDRLAGRPFLTEIPVESLEPIPVAPPIQDISKACLAIVSTAGVVPPGNPDGFRGYQNAKWKKYSLDNLNSMLDQNWDVVHGGYNIQFMKKNPNYGVPLDVCREMEREGIFARLYPYYYVVPGARGLISVMHRIGREMFLDMKAQGVDGVIQVDT